MQCRVADEDRRSFVLVFRVIELDFGGAEIAIRRRDVLAGTLLTWLTNISYRLHQLRLDPLRRIHPNVATKIACCWWPLL